MSKEKIGRKYDREKWGWKNEDDIQINFKHPYYDSDRKQQTESFALKAIFISLILIAAMVLIVNLIH